MIVPGQQLVDELRALGFTSIEGPWDTSYFLPHLKWLDEFSAWWTKEMLPNEKYQIESWDCDDISREARVEAARSILQTGIKGATPAFLYARVLLTIAGNPFGLADGEHVLNICRTEDAGWRWVESEVGSHCDLAAALADGALVPRFVLV